jgi:hypothetical protein
MSLSNEEIDVIGNLITATVAQHHQMMKTIATAASTAAIHQQATKAGNPDRKLNGRIINRALSLQM